jgi:hypothetical protein
VEGCWGGWGGEFDEEVFLFGVVFDQGGDWPCLNGCLVASISGPTTQEQRLLEKRVYGEGGFTLSASQDQTMDWFPIPNVPFFLLFRESISSTSHVLNFCSVLGSWIV